MSFVVAEGCGCAVMILRARGIAIGSALKWPFAMGDVDCYDFNEDYELGMIIGSCSIEKRKFVEGRPSASDTALCYLEMRYRGLKICFYQGLLFYICNAIMTL